VKSWLCVTTTVSCGGLLALGAAWRTTPSNASATIRMTTHAPISIETRRT